MELTQDQYERIAPLFPRQRGNVSLSNLQVLNAILYVAEHGCKWRGLPVGGANSRRTGRLFVVGERRDSLAAPRRLPCVIRTADHATERGVISDRSDA